MEFHACRPTRLSCHDSTYDRICTIRLGRERAPSEDIKLLAFILHLHWTLCLIDCLKEKEKGEKSLDVEGSEDSKAETMETSASGGRGGGTFIQETSEARGGRFLAGFLQRSQSHEDQTSQ